MPACLAGREMQIPKLGQLVRRKVSGVGDAEGTKASVETLFPIYGVGCQEQLHELGHGRASP